MQQARVRSIAHGLEVPVKQQVQGRAELPGLLHLLKQLHLPILLPLQTFLMLAD